MLADQVARESLNYGLLLAWSGYKLEAASARAAGTAAVMEAIATVDATR